MIIATARSLSPSGEDAVEFAVKSLYASLIFNRTGIGSSFSSMSFCQMSLSSSTRRISR